MYQDIWTFLSKNGNTAQTPIVEEVTDDDIELLDPEEVRRYRSHVARCLCFSEERADITSAAYDLNQ